MIPWWGWLLIALFSPSLAVVGVIVLSMLGFKFPGPYVD